MMQHSRRALAVPAFRGTALGLCLCLCAWMVWNPSPVQASVQLTKFTVDQTPPPPPAPTAPTPVAHSSGLHALAAGTDPSVDPTVEYSNLIRSQSAVGPLDSGLLGESIDYYTGQTDFVATDVNLPGNFPLPMGVSRRYHVANRAGGVLPGAFGDWDLDLPHIEGVVATSVGWTVDTTGQAYNECADFGAPPAALVTTTTSHGDVSTTIPASEYAPGYSVVVPGKGRHELLRRDSGNQFAPQGDYSAYPVVTHDWWAAICHPIYNYRQGDPNERFEVTSPDGVTYDFGYYTWRSYPSYQRIADTAQSGVTAVLPRRQVFMLPNMVTDRFGNWVQYAYNRDTTTWQYSLKSITTSDGRTINISYNTDGTIKTVDDGGGGHTWTYTYTSGSLSKVTLPDNSYWSINFANLNTASWTYSGATCTSLPTPTTGGSISGSTVSGTIQHPTGASGTFTFTVTRHGRNSAPATCLTNSLNTSFAALQPSVYDVLSLTKKVITGPKVPSALTWTLAYAGCSTSSCNATKTTTLTDARNFSTLYTFGAMYSATASSDTEGQLQSIQSGGTSGTYLQKVAYTYFTNCGSSCPSSMGTPAQSRGDLAPLSTLKPIQIRTITQDGATYTETSSSPDSYGFPQTITRVGTDTKTDTITYTHDTGLWVIGTPTQTQSAGSTEVLIGLNAFDMPHTVTRFGRLDRTYGYNGDGTLNTVQDGDNNITTYSNYYRGIPRSVVYADSNSESAIVSYNGTITQWNDANNYVTQYGYDAMERLNQITYPGGGSETYSNRTITWNTAATGWTSTVAVGTYQQVTTYDAFLHPVLTNEDSVRYVNRTFDPDGRTLFASYPSTSAAATTGTTSVYDGIGRLTKQTDAGGYFTKYTPAANQMTVLDRDSNSTTYTFKAYDQPSTAWPVTITSPIVTTNIVRDTWGKPTSITRGSITRTRTYNTNQLLWTVIDPERSDTLTLEYDGAANLHKVNKAGALSETRNYDKRNRISTIVYASGDSGVSANYWPDGLLKTSSRGSNSHGYTYNLRRLIKSESVTAGSGTYTLGYGYDALAHRTSLTYPDSTSISYSPNDLGQSTKIGTYATSLTYYPNGAVDTFSYGNGIAHSMTQTSDGRQLPAQSKDVGVFDWTYGYDGNGNPTSISDTSGTNTKTMDYDGGNRLWHANDASLWVSDTFTYDTLDNLTVDQTNSIANGILTNGYPITPASNLPYQFTFNKFGGGTTTTALAYDTEGNLKQKGTGATATNYTFNAANLLTSVAQGGTTYAYTYDGSGTRATSSTTSGTAPGTQVNSVYDYAGQLVYEATTAIANPDDIFQNGFETAPNALTTTKYYYLGSHLVAKDALNGATDTVTYTHTEALGSPIAQTNASKAIVGTSTYLPYGGLYASTGTGNQAGVGYAGQYMDGTGLIYMRARYYDPQLRRFISIDPVDVDASSAGNFNRYSYADNSPYAKYDPSGRTPFGFAVGAVVGLGAGWFNGWMAGDSGYALWISDGGAGAAAGGIIGLTDGLGLLAGLAVNTTAGVGIEALRQESNYGEIKSGGSIIMAGLGGSLGSATTALGKEAMLANGSASWVGELLNATVAGEGAGASGTAGTMVDIVNDTPPTVGPLNMQDQSGTTTQDQGTTTQDQSGTTTDTQGSSDGSSDGSSGGSSDNPGG